MYSLIIFLHVFCTFGFMLAHGGSAAVMFRLREERDRERICALLELVNSTSTLMAWTGGFMFLTGIVGGFMGNWWGRGWIWAALVLLIVISMVMGQMGRQYFDRVRRAVGIPTSDDRKKGITPPPPAGPDDLAAVLQSGRPMVLSTFGLSGLVVIVWLMMYKPF